MHVVEGDVHVPYRRAEDHELPARPANDPHRRVSVAVVWPSARQRCPWGRAHDAPGGNLKVSYQALLRHLQVTQRAVVGNLEVCR